MLCRKCGNTGSTRDNPDKCTACGKSRIKTENITAVSIEDKPNIDYEAIIPARYKNTSFSLQKLSSDAKKGPDGALEESFKLYFRTLGKIFKEVVGGSLPKTSYFISAKPGNAKRTWAYTLIKEAMQNKMSVIPLLDIKDAYYLTIGRQIPGLEELLNGMTVYDLYTADLCILSIDTISARYAFLIQHIVDKRSKLNKPTIFISNISKDALINKVPDIAVYLEHKYLKEVENDTQSIIAIDYYTNKVVTEKDKFFKNLNEQI